MNNNMNKLMEISNEYAQNMKENFQVMTKFWETTKEQTTTYTEKNMELFFDHMNRNVDLMNDIYNRTIKTNLLLSQEYS